MFILGLIYLIVLVVIAILAWRDRSYPGFAGVVLFAIIFFALFWDVMNR